MARKSARPVAELRPGALPLDFEVYGRARTKGSLKTYCIRNAAHTIRVEEQTKDSGLWRLRLARAAQTAMLARTGGLWYLDGPCEVRALVRFAQTDGWESHETLWPTARSIGDSDKLARNLLDALEDSRLLQDDAQVVSLHIVKRWVHGDEEPGIRVLVTDPPEDDPL